MTSEPEERPSVADAAALIVTAVRGALRIEVHAKPRAAKSALRGVRQGALEVAIAAAPVDGAANDELLALLAEALDLPKRDVTLLRGESARTKLVEIAGLDEPDLRARLARSGASR